MPTTLLPSYAEKLRRELLNPLKLRLYFWRQLPMAALAGLRVTELTAERAAVTLRYGYLTKNPFRSLYFACQAMAAELASGVQALLHIRATGAASMLVVGLTAEFTKKAVGTITFTCDDGAAIAQTLAECRAAQQGRTVECTSTGRDASGEVVAVFRVTWSFRGKG